MAGLKIQVPAQLFAPAESLHFSGEFALDSIDAGPDTYTLDEPIKWEADITNTGDALLVMGTCTTVATTACARCLEDATFDVEGQIEGYFLIGDAEAPEDMDEDEFDVLGEDEIIDMEPLLVAAVLLEVPLIPLCDDDCKGLCTKCGANLNEGECGCAPADKADDVMNPFAALANFKFNEE